MSPPGARKLNRGNSSFRCCSLQKPGNKSDREVIQIGRFFLSRIVFFRGLVTIFLIITTVLVSSFTYFILNDLENKLFESQYEIYSSQALNTAEISLKRACEAAQSMATHMATAFPDAAEWPFVTLKNFQENSQSLAELSGGEGTVFIPLVRSTDLAEFNVFMNDYFNSEPTVRPSPLGFRPVVGGRVDPATGELIYHIETTGETYWGSKYNEMFPVLQGRNYSDPFIDLLLGFNLHSILPQGEAIDQVLDCVHNADVDDLQAGRIQCGAMTDIISEISDRINAAIFQPIFPANNRTTLVGLTSSGTNWINVLTGVAPSSISGLDFVVSSPGSTVSQITYTIKNGIPSQRGIGDLHDQKFDKYGQARTLLLPKSLSPASNVYTITMYPRSEFIAIYTTDLPRNATICAVLLIFLTSLTFLIYDHFMKRDSSEKADLLQTKRQFVRFISHEVRTPLNAVAMGLKLLENEFQEALDGIEEDLEQSDGEEANEERRGGDEKVAMFVNGKSVDEHGEEGILIAPKFDDSCNRIKSELALCREKLKLQIEDWKQLSVDITENTSSAVFVLDDLLNYDKIETGSLRLELKEVDIWDLLRKTVHTFELAAKQVKVNLTLHVVRGFEDGDSRTESIKISGYSESSTAEDVVVLSSPNKPFLAIENTASLMSEQECPPAFGMMHYRATSVVPEELLLNQQQEQQQPDDGANCLIDIQNDVDLEAGISTASSRHALLPLKQQQQLQQQRQHMQKSSFHLLSNKPRAETLLVRYPPEAGKVNVLGDVTRLAQVVRNLISNALKFTPEDGSITIVAQWTPHGLPTADPRETKAHAFDVLQNRAGSLRIAVSDTGAGLTEDQLARICSEGVQFNANQLQGGRGSGLGLFITKGIVEQHGGTMVVTSEGLSKGTTFTVELPLYLFPHEKLQGEDCPDGEEEKGEGSGDDGGTEASNEPGNHVSHKRRGPLLPQHAILQTFSDDRVSSLCSSSVDHGICSPRMEAANAAFSAATSVSAASGGPSSLSGSSSHSHSHSHSHSQSLSPYRPLSSSPYLSPSSAAAASGTASLLAERTLSTDGNNVQSFYQSCPRGLTALSVNSFDAAVAIAPSASASAYIPTAQTGTARPPSSGGDAFKQKTDTSCENNNNNSITKNNNNNNKKHHKISKGAHEQQQQEQHQNQNQGYASAATAFPRRVLVVDDAASNRKMLLRLLRNKGCECVEARNGQEALDIYRKTTEHFRGGSSNNSNSKFNRTGSSGRNINYNNNRDAGKCAGKYEPASPPPPSPTPPPPPMEDFDAIFMDFEMPVLNGPDATKLIRALGCQSLIVGITGNVLPSDMRHFVHQGADVVLAKPLQLEEVSRAWRVFSQRTLLSGSSSVKKARR